MPDKHPNTERWGGPGASHEDRSKAPPDPIVKDEDDRDRFSRHAKASGGGGETDIHHGHAPNLKSDFEANDAQKKRH